MDKNFINNLLNIFINNIIPLTEKNVSLGNKIFGAAILRKSDLSLVVSGSNNEIEKSDTHFIIENPTNPTVKSRYMIGEIID